MSRQKLWKVHLFSTISTGASTALGPRAKARITAERDDLCLRYQKVSVEQFAEHRRRVASGAFVEADLMKGLRDFGRERVDEHGLLLIEHRASLMLS